MLLVSNNLFHCFTTHHPPPPAGETALICDLLPLFATVVRLNYFDRNAVKCEVFKHVNIYPRHEHRDYLNCLTSLSRKNRCDYL